MATVDEIRAAAEADLAQFIRLVHPRTLLGSVHEELICWWTRSGAKKQQLVLLPRDHQKSRMIAYRVVWHLTKHPDHRVLYISSTSNLAEKQLKFMKDIFSSDIYRRYWPNHVLPEEGKREKWTEGEISLDHPLRKLEGIRDPSIFTAGLTTSITGLHCDVAVLDDVVVKENAYTREGRDKVSSQYSLLSSIESADAEEWVVGTRYHPSDLYQIMQDMGEETFSDQGELMGTEDVYEIFERQVEDRGDGTGEFIWPRQQRSDGKWFGFDIKVLARKRAKYVDKTQYHAQYYNNPNIGGDSGVPRDRFQYYDKGLLRHQEGSWYYAGMRMNIYAAIDFAFSLNKRADYSALVVVGATGDGNIYVLDIERFKTDRISEYYKYIFEAHNKWGFQKIRAEVTAAQKAIVVDLKNNYIKPEGIALSVDEHSPRKEQGSKEERILANLQPRYDNLQMWHYRGGNCQILEDELAVENPPHDDVKDALSAVTEIIRIPTMQRKRKTHTNVVDFHPRFGGVAH